MRPPSSFCKISFAFLLLSPPLQGKQVAEEDNRKAKLILETTMQDLNRALKQVKKQQERNDKLRAEYETLSEALETVEEKVEEEIVCQIRHAGQRGNPVTDKFIRHCRTLLATGSSARSVREQLFLNAGFFWGRRSTPSSKQLCLPCGGFNSKVRAWEMKVTSTASYELRNVKR